jgi:hypothetical protein
MSSQAMTSWHSLTQVMTSWHSLTQVMTSWHSLTQVMTSWHSLICWADSSSTYIHTHFRLTQTHRIDLGPQVPPPNVYTYIYLQTNTNTKPIHRINLGLKYLRTNSVRSSNRDNSPVTTPTPKSHEIFSSLKHLSTKNNTDTCTYENSRSSIVSSSLSLSPSGVYSPKVRRSQSCLTDIGTCDKSIMDRCTNGQKVTNGQKNMVSRGESSHLLHSKNQNLSPKRDQNIKDVMARRTDSAFCGLRTNKTHEGGLKKKWSILDSLQNLGSPNKALNDSDSSPRNASILDSDSDCTSVTSATNLVGSVRESRKRFPGRWKSLPALFVNTGANDDCEVQECMQHAFEVLQCVMHMCVHIYPCIYVCACVHGACMCVHTYSTRFRYCSVWCICVCICTCMHT